MSRIFLLLNDPLVAGRMRALVDATPGLQTVGWVATMDQARAQLPSLQADLVLTDIQLADGWVAGLVDELQVIFCPVVVGGGKRFFPDGVRLSLELLDERRFGNGVVVMRYAVRG